MGSSAFKVFLRIYERIKIDQDASKLYRILKIQEYRMYVYIVGVSMMVHSKIVHMAYRTRFQWPLVLLRGIGINRFEAVVERPLLHLCLLFFHKLFHGLSPF